MAVFRVERTRDYTVMCNHHLKDSNLSLKAKGLLSMMLSLPDEWNYTTRGLAAICKEGVDAIGKTLKELELAGYIIRRQLRGKDGRISDTEYTIFEKPRKLHPLVFAKWVPLCIACRFLAPVRTPVFPSTHTTI